MDIVLFDLGRTLMYFDGPLPEVIEQADHAMVQQLKQAGLEFDEARFLTAFHLHEEDDNDGRGKEFREFPTRITMKQLLAKYGFTNIADSLIDRAADALFKITQEYWHPEEDALPVIRQLAQEGYHLGIVSNASDDRDVQDLVDKLGARPYMEIILTSAAAGIRKPNPKIFHKALERWGAQPSQAVMIGDRLDADIAGAHNTGMPGIWITRRLPPEEKADHHEAACPEATVTSLLEIPEILHRMGNAPSKNQHFTR